MQRHLGFLCVQTVVVGDTEEEEMVAELVASGVLEGVVAPEEVSTSLGGFAVDSEVDVVAGSLQILNTG